MLLNTICVLSALLGGVISFLSGMPYIHWLWLWPVSFAGCFLVLLGLAVGYLFYILSKVDMDTPTEHDDPGFRKIVGVYAHAFCTILGMRFHVTGLEKRPAEGRFLVVSNHLHEMDIPALYFPFEKMQMSFVSKKENRDMFVVGKVMHQLACPLMDRENNREGLKTILKCVKLLEDDELSLCIFPEGYTSLDGHLQRFRPGALKIATKAHVPIVVCTLQNTNKVMRNIKHLRHTDIEVHILDVITPEQQEGKTTVELGERIYAMMAADLPAEYAPISDNSEI